MFRNAALTLLVLATMTTSAWALDAEQAEQVAETRQSVMTVIRWNVVPMAGMVKERIPYDAERFRLYSDRVAFMTTMIADAFRPDTRDNQVETKALDVIWEESDEFERLAGAVKEQADALNAAAMGGDFASVQAAFLDLGQACKDCHDEFQEETD